MYVVTSLKCFVVQVHCFIGKHVAWNQQIMQSMYVGGCYT